MWVNRRIQFTSYDCENLSQVAFFNLVFWSPRHNQLFWAALNETYMQKPYYWFLWVPLNACEYAQTLWRFAFLAWIKSTLSRFSRNIPAFGYIWINNSALCSHKVPKSRPHTRGSFFFRVRQLEITGTKYLNYNLREIGFNPKLNFACAHAHFPLSRTQ